MACARLRPTHASRAICTRSSFLAACIAAAYFARLNLRRSIEHGFNIDASFLKRSSVPVPPLDEQRAIADFLDRETSKIDALVAKKERLIELLQEKRTALITHAVTKGLDPNAPMKPSGIDWLGDIPAHWEVKRLWHLTPDSRSIMYGIVCQGRISTGEFAIVKGGEMFHLIGFILID